MPRFFIIAIICLSLSACSHPLSTAHQKQDKRHYIVVDASVSNPEQYDQFIALEQNILQQFGAHLEMDIQSEDRKQRHLIIVFPDAETVKKFVASPEFQEILPLGKGSAKSKIFHGKRIK
jgi:uncharacterized protein (DUF1330 family)